MPATGASIRGEQLRPGEGLPHLVGQSIEAIEVGDLLDRLADALGWGAELPAAEPDQRPAGVLNLSLLKPFLKPLFDQALCNRLAHGLDLPLSFRGLLQLDGDGLPVWPLCLRPPVKRPAQQES